MGSYCVTCAISGLPIHPGDPVVGWSVIESPFGSWSGSIAFVPTSIPVIGTYNDYGGIEAGLVDDSGEFHHDALEGDGMVAICHLELWKKQIKQFKLEDFSGKNAAVSLVDQFAAIRKEYTEQLTRYKALIESNPGNDTAYWNERSKPFNCAHEALHRSSPGVSYMWYITDKFLLGVEGKVKTKGVGFEERQKISQEDKCGEFETQLVNAVINGISNQSLELLEGMIKIYASAIYRNRPIMPTQMVPCTQYPDMKKEFAWTKTVYEFALALRNEKRREEKNFNARMKRIHKKNKAKS
jgi:hypothetical protein